MLLLIAFTGVIKPEGHVTQVTVEQQLEQQTFQEELPVSVDDAGEPSRLEKVQIYTREAIDVARYMICRLLRKIKTVTSNSLS